MKTAEYWQIRAEQIANIQHRKADRYIANELRREYEKARVSIQRQIDSFYARFAVDNQISLSEARKLLSASELDDFKLTLSGFIALAKNNPDGRWTVKLNNASTKVRVSRLESLMIEVEAAIQSVNMAQNAHLTGLLADGYQDTYYRSIYEVQRGLGVGTRFKTLNMEQVERIVRTPWLEQNYSQRIWGDNSRLVRQLETEITQAIIRGEDNRKVARRISDRMGVGYRNASRLVRTEMSHIQNEAALRSYRESGVVQKYEFIAALDEKTCDICSPLDGKVFTFAEAQTGVNLAPLHPNCRCDTIPYFDDAEDAERAARDSEGKTYNVPGDMTYAEWHKKYVGG